MIKVTLLQEGGVPVGKGLPLELIANSTVVARAVVGNEGVVEFDCQPAAHAQLAVRIDQDAVFRLEAEALQARTK
jgi:hypothetical protein